MGSTLSPIIFRRLIVHGSYVCRHCYWSGARAFPRRPVNYNAHSTGRRGFLNWGRRLPRKIRDEPDVARGLEPLLALNNSVKTRTRPPPANELIDGLKTLFKAKNDLREPLVEFEAVHARRAFLHLQETNKDEEHFGLSTDDLHVGLFALVSMPKDNIMNHNVFARDLFEEIKRRKAQDSRVSLLKALEPFVRILCQTKCSVEAREIALADWKEYPMRKGTKSARILWRHVLSGLASERSERELKETITMMEENGVPFDAQMHQVVATYYARKDDREATKTWFAHPIAEDSGPTSSTISSILRFCIRNDELEWGSSIFRGMLEKNPDKENWDIIFQWGAAQGKGVDEIERMMQVMLRRNEGNEDLRPDIDTINGLVEFANSRNDPYSAERYITLGEKWGILPNARTFILQMDYRINVGDLSGAIVAYEKLQIQDITGGEDVPVINRLIQAMCSAKGKDPEDILKIVEDLKARNARLEPATVSALCILHLNRDELEDVIDILNTHCFHFSLDQRAEVRNVLFNYCLDKSVSVGGAWETYMIFRSSFEETSIDIRTRMMQEFFDRKRSDMAVLCFGHMRQHIRQSQRPIADTYVKCFEGIAGSGDLEGLELVHNMLKMDVTIEPSTKLYNSLMKAYTSCEMPVRSLEYWQDIQNSHEGPTYSSIIIALQACEVAPSGEETARKIWEKLQKMDIEVTKEVYTAYIGALAGHGLFEEATQLVDNMEKETGSKPDVLVLGTLYNASPGSPSKEAVETWATEKYPTAWEELTRVGQIIKEEFGDKLFKIDRNVAA